MYNAYDYYAAMKSGKINNSNLIVKLSISNVKCISIVRSSSQTLQIAIGKTTLRAMYKQFTNIFVCLNLFVCLSADFPVIYFRLHCNRLLLKTYDSS